MLPRRQGGYVAGSRLDINMAYSLHDVNVGRAYRTHTSVFSCPCSQANTSSSKQCVIRQQLKAGKQHNYSSLLEDHTFAG